MASTPYAFTRGLDHDAIVSASEQVARTVDDVLDARSFDASRTMVPTSWVGTDGLPFLDEEAQRTLNHCRAFSYVHLLGNYEEFIPFHLSALVQQEAHGARPQRRALLRFGDEEMRATLRETLHRSLSAIIVGIALGHPSFARVARDVLPAGAARLLGS